MRFAIINKSDATGGAAVVSHRLADALRRAGHSVSMVVVEKLTDDPDVKVAATPEKVRIPFLAERLDIFLRNGLDRESLFKIDTASAGLPLWHHPDILSADVILLNWVNQGMLSLKGVEKLLKLGKPVFWTMHDMWNMTGICHHAGECPGYLGECRQCPLLKGKLTDRNMAHRVWKKKKRVYEAENLSFVAVSNWLAAKAAESSLLGNKRVYVIPNPFQVPERVAYKPRREEIRILFGAARLDDPIKNLPLLKETLRIFRERYPELAEKVTLVTYGNAKDPQSLEGFPVRHTHMGRIEGETALADLYRDSDIVISTSRYETLPGTLVEGQAYGAIPVATPNGGQPDIITHLETGYLANQEPSTAPNPETPIATTATTSETQTAVSLAEGLRWAIEKVKDPAAYHEIREKMLTSLKTRFAAEKIANAYTILPPKICVNPPDRAKQDPASNPQTLKNLR